MTECSKFAVLEWEYSKTDMFFIKLPNDIPETISCFSVAPCGAEKVKNI